MLFDLEDGLPPAEIDPEVCGVLTNGEPISKWLGRSVTP